MTPLELRELPQFSKFPSAYVAVRNHILMLWQQDVNSYVTAKVAQKNIQVRPLSTVSH